MERSREHEDLAIALAEIRPAPRDDFAAELDQRVAAGFRPRPRLDSSPFAALLARLRFRSRGRLLLASGSAALAAIAIATVVIASNDSPSAPVALNSRRDAGRSDHVYPFSRAIPRASNGSLLSRGAGEESSSATQGAGQSSGAAVQESSAGERPSSNSASNSAYSALGRTAHREIERSAEIGLFADPADVADDSAKVFSAVHNAHGIVLHSTTTAGKRAGASFDLLIPSARLGDALAAFSAIDEVSSRDEATADITAPTVALGEQLQDSQAKVDGLLAQLAGAETEAESEAIGFQLHAERQHAAQLRARLAQLHRRTTYSRVSVRIESGASTGSGSAWGIDDAFGDAGHILGVAAGVTVVGLAVIAPLALLVLLAWLAHRLWLRGRRERALDA